MSLDAITSRIRQDAGADFAFILTRKGRLLTREAPPQMPEIGRATCVAAANEALAIGASLVERTMAREQLVPFGGAAPVDVFVSPCGEAIVCVVLATWADASAVGPALEAHIPQLEALLADAKEQRGVRTRTGRTIAPPAPPPPPDAIPPGRSTPRPVAGQVKPPRPPRERGSSRPGRPSRPPPSSRRAARSSEVPPSSAARPSSPMGSARPPSARARPLAGLVEMSKSGIRASQSMQDGPTIQVGPPAAPPAIPRPPRAAFTSEVPLGGRGSLPQIDVGEAPLGRETIAAIQADGHARGSIPHIEVHETMLGRETLAAIDEDHDAERAPAVGRPPPGIDRSTQPWSETAEAALSALQAASLERKHAPPTIETAPVPPVPARGKRKQNSNVDLFREALGEMMLDGEGSPDDRGER